MQELTIEIDFDWFPPEHTCDGDDRSPAIRVRGSDAPYLAVVVDDPDAPRGTFTHWLAWNIPSVDEIPRASRRSPGFPGRFRPSRERTTFGGSATPAPARRKECHTVSSYGSGAWSGRSRSHRVLGVLRLRTRSRQLPPVTGRQWRPTSAGRFEHPRPEQGREPEGTPCPQPFCRLS